MLRFPSKVLARVLGTTPMDANKLMNTIGLLCNVGYISLCTLTLQWFKCTPHPNAASVVSDYPDTNCEDRSLVGVAIVAVIVYIIGIFCVCTYACVIAPAQYSDKDFIVRTKFLIVRWNPSKWWFGLVCMIRNLLISLVGVIVPDVMIVQLAITATIVSLYCALQATARPWRDQYLNWTDTILAQGVTLLCVFGIVLAPIETDFKDRLESYGWIGIVIVWTTLLVLFAAFYRAMDAFLRPDAVTKHRELIAGETAGVMFMLSKTVQDAKKALGKDELADLMTVLLTQDEQRDITHYAVTILNEVYEKKVTTKSAQPRLLAKTAMAEADMGATRRASTNPQVVSA
jgi:Trp operon repressor